MYRRTRLHLSTDYVEGHYVYSSIYIYSIPIVIDLLYVYQNDGTDLPNENSGIIIIQNNIYDKPAQGLE